MIFKIIFSCFKPKRKFMTNTGGFNRDMEEEMWLSCVRKSNAVCLAADIREEKTRITPVTRSFLFTPIRILFQEHF